MDANIFLLQPSNSCKSSLDKAYTKHIRNITNTLSEEEETRWEIYSVIILQFINQGKGEFLKEMKYRLTDGENPNEIILDMINREKDNVESLTWFLKRRIEEFIEEDFFKRFSD